MGAGLRDTQRDRSGVALRRVAGHGAQSDRPEAERTAWPGGALTLHWNAVTRKISGSHARCSFERWATIVALAASTLTEEFATGTPTTERLTLSLSES